MRDIPVFTTENGVASLTLREIPFSRRAYIQIRDSQTPEELLTECAEFCRLAGAMEVYAREYPGIEKYPLHSAVWEMTALREALPDTDACLFPVTEETLPRWLELYRTAMENVDHAAGISQKDGEKLLERKGAYFVHRQGELLGIGLVDGCRLETMAAFVPGAGAQVLATLNHALSGEQAVLEVASTNAKAIRLYERLGFLKTRELVRWYRTQ